MAKPCENADAWRGRCCCNCVYQMQVMKHPWNSGESSGRITEQFGWLCAVPDMLTQNGVRQAIFFQREHGMCEEHEWRSGNE